MSVVNYPYIVTAAMSVVNYPYSHGRNIHIVTEEPPIELRMYRIFKSA